MKGIKFWNNKSLIKCSAIGKVTQEVMEKISKTLPNVTH